MPGQSLGAHIRSRGANQPHQRIFRLGFFSMVGTFNPSAHFIRSACEIFHGLALRSIPLKTVSNASGKPAFHHRRLRRNIQNVAHGFIAHGADIHAGAASCAGPRLLLRDHFRIGTIHAAAGIQMRTFFTSKCEPLSVLPVMYAGQTSCSGNTWMQALKAVHDLFPAKVFHGRCANSLDRRVVEIDVFLIPRSNDAAVHQMSKGRKIGVLCLE